MVIFSIHFNGFALFDCVIWFIFGTDIEILTDWNVEITGTRISISIRLEAILRFLKKQITLEL